VLELLEPATGGFAVDARAFPAVLGPNAARTVDVTFTSGADAVATGSMLVRFKAGDRLASVRVRLDATVETPTLVLLTPQVALGDVYIDETTARFATLRNTSTVTPVKVYSLTSLPTGITLSGGLGDIAPGTAANVSVRWSPTAIANHDVDVVLLHDASGPPLTMRVTARATTWRPEQVIDFGFVSLTDGETDWLEVPVPPHGISLSIEAVAADTTLGLLGLEGPGGHLYENDTATGEFLWFEGDEVFTATVPSSDRTQLKLVPGGGTYRFRLYRMAGSANSFDIRVVIHNRPGGSAAGGVVDLNVFLADGLGFDEFDAPTEPRLQDLLEEADRIFSQHDLQIGSVKYFTLTDAAFDEIGSDSEFGDMLEESQRGMPGRLSLFFVLKTLSGGVLGVAPRIAGPSTLGTRASGVMIDYDSGTATRAGYVTAHEVGHFLGLLHTTEQSGGHDLIDDTLECPATGTDATCSVEGNANLMHWRVLSSDPVITDGQALVILGHPLVGLPGPSLAAFEPGPVTSPFIVAALPEGWCGTPGCCTAAK